MANLDVGIHTFCVAPIVDDTSTGRVEFWAVGVDCCKNRGDFVCDDAGVANVRSGVVLSDRNHDDVLFETFGRKLAPALERRDLFLKAIQRAEHVHGLVSAENPVLVRWTLTSRETLTEQATVRLATALVVAGLVAGLVAVMLTALTQNLIGAERANQAEVGGFVMHTIG